MAKILAMRLDAVVHKIINPMQTGFIKGRNISENILTLTNVIDYCNENNISAVLLSIDFHKAFESLEWDSIKMVLKHLNFGNWFIDAISTLYNDTMSCVMNNGYWSDWFKISCRACQGYPISPIIFTIIVETLRKKNRQNPYVKGICISDTTTTIGAQYADDFWLSL